MPAFGLLICERAVAKLVADPRARVVSFILAGRRLDVIAGPGQLTC
jgi:hypothetical protein